MTGSDSETERKRQEKAVKKTEKAERKKTSKPSSSRSTGGGGGGSKKKKLTKLPGQPKKPMGAYFLWLQAEGREKIKVRFNTFIASIKCIKIYENINSKY